MTESFFKLYHPQTIPLAGFRLLYVLATDSRFL